MPCPLSILVIHNLHCRSTAPYRDEQPVTVSTLWRSLTGHQLRPHRKMVHGRRDDYRRLLEIVQQQPLVAGGERVMGSDLRLDRILHEIEARNADFIECEMIGPAGYARPHDDDAEVAERPENLLEDRRRSRV